MQKSEVTCHLGEKGDDGIVALCNLTTKVKRKADILMGDERICPDGPIVSSFRLLFATALFARRDQSPI